MKNDKSKVALTVAGILLGVLWLTITAVVITGYVKCVVKFCECDFEPSYKAEVFYGIGTFTGAGVVIGYLDLGK